MSLQRAHVCKCKPVLALLKVRWLAVIPGQSEGYSTARFTVSFNCAIIQAGDDVAYVWPKNKPKPPTSQAFTTTTTTTPKTSPHPH